jgi:hypothetical protein
MPTERRAVSPGQEPIDVRRGRNPLVTETDTTMTFELGILGGVMRTEIVRPDGLARVW